MASTHRVRRVVFDLHCEEHTTAFKARRRFEVALRDRITDVLEEVFDSYSPNGRPHTIPYLQIDLGRVDVDRLDDLQLRDLVLKRLRRRFLEMGTEDVVVDARRLAPQDILIGFLQTGHLPWDSPAESLTDVQRLVLNLSDEETASLAAGLRSVLRDYDARFRLSHQFGAAFFEWVLGLIDEEALEFAMRRLRRTDGSLDTPERRMAVVSAVISSLDSASEHVVHALEQVLTLLETGGRYEPELEEAAEVIAAPERGTTYYTHKAGLVMLHPFLPRFFRALHLVDEQDVFLSSDSRARAVHLLHFIAVGTIGPEEQTLTLEKVLTGYPVNAPIPLNVDLRDWEIDECDTLLDAVVEHWGKLRNTSSEGLREGFLRREGRLLSTDTSWELTVESRGLDVLLDALPWGLSYVRLPWMSAGIHVIWG